MSLGQKIRGVAEARLEATTTALTEHQLHIAAQQESGAPNFISDMLVTGILQARRAMWERIEELSTPEAQLKELHHKRHTEGVEI